MPSGRLKYLVNLAAKYWQEFSVSHNIVLNTKLQFHIFSDKERDVATFKSSPSNFYDTLWNVIGERLSS